MHRTLTIILSEKTVVIGRFGKQWEAILHVMLTVCILVKGRREREKQANLANRESGP